MSISQDNHFQLVTKLIWINIYKYVRSRFRVEVSSQIRVHTYNKSIVGNLPVLDDIVRPATFNKLNSSVCWPTLHNIVGAGGKGLLLREPEVVQSSSVILRVLERRR